ncbi:MAG: DUF3499 family protein [Microthrixaceae bacterium]
MTRQCMRPGCDRRASAWVTYDANSSAVWLQDPRDDDEPAQLVCSLHAESLTVPLGWSVTDRRSLAGHNWVQEPLDVGETATEQQMPESPTALDGSPPERSKTPHAEELDSQPTPAPPKPAPAEPTAPAAPVVPAASAEGDQDANADDDSTRRKPRKNSLLDRAFEWTGPQHSVLTTDTPEATEDESPPSD